MPEKSLDNSPQSDSVQADSPQPTFESLGLSAITLAAVEHARYATPSAVQAGVIPVALQGKDMMAQARTGTGKTAAFTLPILELLDHAENQGAGLRALILVPTRELAVQVSGEIKKLSHGRKIQTIPVYGGKPIRQQILKLKKGADIIVGTPGRVLDHLARGSLDFSGIQIVVLDEADRMLDIGFRPDIEKILRKCPSDRQTLLLSATVPTSVERLAQRYMHEPLILNFSPDIASDTIDQFYFTVDEEKKFDLLLKLIDREQPSQSIIFCRTRRRTERIFRKLAKKHSDSDGIHGDMAQGARDRVMQKFREGKVRFLVATDVVGRGIDISGLSHIINYDLPESCDDYVHRVGRTGRMGAEGVAYSFVTPEEGSELTRIEMRVNQLLQRAEMEGFVSYNRPENKNSESVGSVERFGFGIPNEPKPEPSTEKPEAENRPTPPGGRPRKKYRRAL